MAANEIPPEQNPSRLDGPAAQKVEAVGIEDEKDGLENVIQSHKWYDHCNCFSSKTAPSPKARQPRADEGGGGTPRSDAATRTHSVTQPTRPAPSSGPPSRLAPLVGPPARPAPAPPISQAKDEQENLKSDSPTSSPPIATQEGSTAISQREASMSNSGLQGPMTQAVLQQHPFQNEQSSSSTASGSLASNVPNQTPSAKQLTQATIISAPPSPTTVSQMHKPANPPKDTVSPKPQSEQARDPEEIETEDNIIKELQEPVPNLHTNRLMTLHFEEDEKDENYERWSNDSDIREKLATLATSAIGKTQSKMEKVYYIEYAKTRENNQSSNWEHGLVIGCDTESDVKKVNEKLEAYKNSSYLKHFKQIRVEVGRGVKITSHASNESVVSETLARTAIMAQNPESHNSLCGLSCHVVLSQGGVGAAKSCFTIGGVIHINGHHFGLTSAHPLKEKIEFGGIVTGEVSSKIELGKVFLEKFGLRTDPETTEPSLGLDWALISIHPQYCKSDSILLPNAGSSMRVSIDGFCTTNNLSSGKVWICASRGSRMGILFETPILISIRNTVFDARTIRLSGEGLVDGDSGARVVRHERLCGVIIARDTKDPLAYMLPIEPIFLDIYQELTKLWQEGVSKPETWLYFSNEGHTPEPVQDIPNGKHGPDQKDAGGRNLLSSIGDSITSAITEPSNRKGVGILSLEEGRGPVDISSGQENGLVTQRSLGQPKASEDRESLAAKEDVDITSKGQPIPEEQKATESKDMAVQTDSRSEKVDRDDANAVMTRANFDLVPIRNSQTLPPPGMRQEYLDAIRRIQHISEEMGYIFGNGVPINNEAGRILEEFFSSRDIILRNVMDERQTYLLGQELFIAAEGSMRELRRIIDSRTAFNLVAANGVQKTVKSLLWPIIRRRIMRDLFYIERTKSLFLFTLEINQGAVLRQLIEREGERERQSLLEWVSNIDYASQQSIFISQRQEGTGFRVLDSSEFRNWTESTGQIMFCPGMPGVGKTIVTSIVVDHLSTRFQNDNTVGIAYFYFNFHDGLKLTDPFLSLLRQLLERLPLLPESVERFYRDHKNNPPPSIDQVTELISTLIKYFERTFIILDALDECTLANGALSRLFDELFSFQARTQLNLFATSRFIPDIQKLFKSSIYLEIRADQGDIRRYLKSHISQLPSFVLEDSELEYAIIESIIEFAAPGIFRLAQLYLESLTDKSTPKALKSALRTFPKSPVACDEFYWELMGRIKAQKPGFEDLAKRVISWIAFAKRPLTSLELRHALAVEIDEIEIDEGNIPRIEDMIAVCLGVVVVEDEIIRLVYSSFQEYLERTQVDWFLHPESDITKACITYLWFGRYEDGFCSTDEEFEERLERYPFYDYASRNWGKHAHSTSMEVDNLTLRLLESDAKVAACSQAMLASKGRSGYSQDVPRNTTGIHVAAYFGLLDTIMALLKRGHNPNLKDSNGHTPLWWATENGHEEAVQFVLDNFAEQQPISKDFLQEL